MYTDLPKHGESAGLDCDPQPVTGAATPAPPTQFWGMLFHPIWCLRCDGPSYVETIPTTRELMATAALRRLPAKVWEHIYDNELLRYHDSAFRTLYDGYARRTSAPKCVLCGTDTYLRLDDDVAKPTGLAHEACWGSPIVQQHKWISPWYGRVRDYVVRCHDVNGNFAWAEASFMNDSRLRYSIALHPGGDRSHHADLMVAINAILCANIDAGLAALTPLVARDVPAALGILGALHYAGQGVAQDGPRAIALLTAAMVAGDGAAPHNLASVYHTGMPGVDQDRQRGQELYRTARRMGAQFSPDRFYRFDHGDDWGGDYYGWMMH